MVLFGFFSLVLVAIYWINTAVRVFDRLLADGQSALSVLSYTALSLPLVIAIVLPLSAFAATAYVTNRLNSESELVVVQATGIGPFRMARPYAVFGLIASLMTGILFNALVPSAYRSAAEQRAVLARNITAQFLTPGEFIHPVKGVTFYISDITPTGVLRSVFLTDARDEQSMTTYMASEAYLLAMDTGPRLVMIDGIAQWLTPGDRRLSVTRFEDFTYDIGRLIPAVRPPKPAPRELPTLDLLRAEPELIEKLGSTRARFLWEANIRIVQSLFPMVTVIGGFSILLLGSFTRFGIWRQILAAIIVMAMLKMLDNWVSTMARTTAELWPAMYAALGAGVILSLALLGWSTRSRRRPRSQAPDGNGAAA